MNLLIARGGGAYSLALSTKIEVTVGLFGKKYFMFGGSWTELSVLGSDKFGQAKMDFVFYVAQDT